MGTGIKLDLSGFEDMLKKIEKADGNIEKAAEQCLKQSAQIMQEQLKLTMSNKDIDDGLISRMPNYTIENNGARVTARVGYKATSYNPNYLSDYFKAMFLNYGTPHRKKHGQERARGFITQAKKAAKPKIKAQQEKALNDILKDLTK